MIPLTTQYNLCVKNLYLERISFVAQRFNHAPGLPWLRRAPFVYLWDRSHHYLGGLHLEGGICLGAFIDPVGVQCRLARLKPMASKTWNTCSINDIITLLRFFPQLTIA